MYPGGIFGSNAAMYDLTTQFQSLDLELDNVDTPMSTDSSPETPIDTLELPSHQSILSENGNPREHCIKLRSGRNSQESRQVQSDALALRLIRKNAAAYFMKNYQATLSGWISLVVKTSLPIGVVSSDSQVITTFRVLDNAISKPGVLSRLAYIQLIRTFRTLEERIAEDRQCGRIHREVGYRNASVAVDIYMSAQDSRPDVNALRRELLERKRTGRRWTELAGPSPLCLLLYSSESEIFVCVLPNL